MFLSKMLMCLLLASVMVLTNAMVQNETCNNSADCLEGLVCEKQICMDAPISKVPKKRHSRSFNDRPQLCVLPLVCFP